MGGQEMKLDKWGYQVNTLSDDCVSAINSYYYQVLSYGRKRSVILEAVRHDPNCVLANILAAHYLCYANPSSAPTHFEAAKSGLDKASLYEKAVYDAVSYMTSENRDDDAAFHLHDKLLQEFPRDLLSLKRAQIICFYMGRPDLFLNLVEQVLPENLEADYIYGMFAFALLEVGRMVDAEKAAKKGYEIDDQDCWAHHAICHVLQYECRFKEAVEFMKKCSPSWSSCSSFILTHNWWHVALCYMEGNAPVSNILDIYNNYIWKELKKPDTVCPEVYLNALGLLLRMHVRGQIHVFEEQLRNLVARLKDRASWYIEWHLDLLILWALAYVGENALAEELFDGLKSRFSRMSKKKQATMQKGILLAEAILKYGGGKYKQALELLGSDFDANLCKAIGASDEQLDVFNEVWYSMLLSAGHVSKVIEEIESRIKQREGAPFLWQMLERAYKLKGMTEAAAAASEKVRALEATYFK